MGDPVQIRIEETFLELDQYKLRGLFEPSEIKALVKRRTYFENLLFRQAPKKVDYLRYIEYELNLNALREKRAGRMVYKVVKRDDPKRRKTQWSMLSSMSNPAFARHVALKRCETIFERALSRYMGDVNLWLQYLEELKRLKKHSLLAKTYSRAIRVHPTKPQLWLQAASYEYGEQGYVLGARALFQRGLRLNPTSTELWLEYFKMELLYAEKLCQRHELMEDHQTPSKEDAGEEEKVKESTTLDGEVHVDIPVLREEEESGEGQTGDKATPTFSNEDEASESKPANLLLEGAIPRVVFTNAVNHIPDNVEFRMQFAKLYHQFPRFSKNSSVVYQSVKQDFPQQPKVVVFVAEVPLHGVTPDAPEYVDALAECTSTLDEALSGSHDGMLYSAAHTCLTTHLAQIQEPHLYTFIVKKLVQWGKLGGRDSFSVQDNWVQYSVQLGEWALSLVDVHANTPEQVSRDTLKSALTAACQLISKVVIVSPHVDTLWLVWVSLTEQLQALRRSAEDNADVTSADEDNLQNPVLDWYQRALEACSESPALWKAYLKFLMSQWRRHNKSNATSSAQQRVQGLFDKALGQVGQLISEVGAEIRGEVHACYVHWLYKAGGLDLVRSASSAFSARFIPSHRFYYACIEKERAHGADAKNVLALYERLVQVQPEATEPWLMYLNYLHHSVRNVKLATSVYWKAVKAVASKPQFETAYQKLLDGQMD
ncbi:U3 snoRNP protein [Dispira parvispora]|uniref:U3 snoRNP protein n=1 Tax=Dispira parvispora TaxID=1520584 RepID=A0A9W8E8U7_9FUNG|nr:U3 snoRNP protein [Dispira parvispora]